MTTKDPETQLVGFENAANLRDLLRKFGVCQDYPGMLPAHLAGILRQQHPDVVLDRVELLSQSDCRVGGMKDEGKDNVVRVQDMEFTIKLRVALHVGETKSLLGIRLVLKCTGLDAIPAMVSDMFVLKL